MPFWIEFTEPVKLPHRIWDFELRREVDVVNEVTAVCVHSVYRDEWDKVPWQQRNALIDCEAAAPVKAVYSLPYGAWPSLDPASFGDFCRSPEQCKGRSSCPHSRACSE